MGARLIYKAEKIIKFKSPIRNIHNCHHESKYINLRHNNFYLAFKI